MAFIGSSLSNTFTLGYLFEIYEQKLTCERFWEESDILTRVNQGFSDVLNFSENPPPFPMDKSGDFKRHLLGPCTVTVWKQPPGGVQWSIDITGAPIEAEDDFYESVEKVTSFVNLQFAKQVVFASDPNELLGLGSVADPEGDLLPAHPLCYQIGSSSATESTVVFKLDTVFSA